MKIQYIKIIREIMGEEASKRGYRITRGYARLSTRTHAIFNKKEGDKSLSFFITENLFKEGTLSLNCGRGMSGKFEDEASYRECIKSFNDYMIGTGYDKLEELMKKPIFSDQDEEYVKNNYEQMAIDFFKAQELDWKNLGTKESLMVVFDRLKQLFSKDWNDSKEELLALSACMTYILVNSEYKFYTIEKKNRPSIYLERKNAPKPTSESSTNLVYYAYMRKSIERIIFPILKRYFSEDEWTELGLESRNL